MTDISIMIVIGMLFHWIGDFLFQTDKQAINKSNSNYYLGIHCVSYGFVMLFLVLLYDLSWFFLFINVATHFVIDYITSRINKKLWKAEERHWFFVSIGFDQFLHVSILILTMLWKRN